MGIRFRTSFAILRNLTLHNRYPSRSLRYHTRRLALKCQPLIIEQGTLVVELSEISRANLEAKNGKQVENKSEIFHSLSLVSDTLLYKNKTPRRMSGCNFCLLLSANFLRFKTIIPILITKWRPQFISAIKRSFSLI